MLTLDAAAVQQSTPWHELMEAIERLLVVGTGNLAPNLALAHAAGRHPGRTSDSEITLFKSVGFALSDLAAARLVHRRIASGAVGSPDAGASHS
ncbi:MAG: hypothetical protein OXF65_03950 [Acidimicrobiaceae bacterium]|nr:hypothetical protein [Acidimicrobiaceae bacterium]